MNILLVHVVNIVTKNLEHWIYNFFYLRLYWIIRYFKLDGITIETRWQMVKYDGINISRIIWKYSRASGELSWEVIHLLQWNISLWSVLHVYRRKVPFDNFSERNRINLLANAVQHFGLFEKYIPPPRSIIRIKLCKTATY